MAYTINEAIQDYEERLATYKKIIERYPDAHQEELTDGYRVWVSNRVEPTHFSFHVDRRSEKDASQDSIQIHMYALMDKIRIYSPVSRNIYVIDQMPKTDPKFYAEILSWLKR